MSTPRFEYSSKSMHVKPAEKEPQEEKEENKPKTKAADSDEDRVIDWSAQLLAEQICQKVGTG